MMATPTAIQHALRASGNGFVRLWADRANYGALMRAEAWLVLLALFASVVLALPDQVIELYRIIYADFRLVEVLKLALSIAVMSASLGFTSSILAAMVLAPGDAVSGHIRPYARFLPFLLAALPIISCGVGHFAAMPKALMPEKITDLQQVGSPWWDFAQTLAQQVDAKLRLLGCLYIVAGLGVIGIGILRRRHPLPQIAVWAARHDDPLHTLPAAIAPEGENSNILSASALRMNTSRSAPK
jgi:hypothetical protein